MISIFIFFTNNFNSQVGKSNRITKKRYKHNMQSMSSNTHHPHFQLSKDNENNNNHHHQHQQHEPEYISTGTSLHNTNNGTFTPITQTHSHEYLMMMGEETIINNNNNKLDIEMITEDKFFQPQQHIENLNMKNVLVVIYMDLVKVIIMISTLLDYLIFLIKRSRLIEYYYYYYYYWISLVWFNIIC